MEWMFRCDGEKRGDGNHNTTMFSTIGEDKESCEGEASPTSAPPVSPTSASPASPTPAPPVSSTSATSSTDTSAATSTTDGIAHLIFLATDSSSCIRQAKEFRKNNGKAGTKSK